MRRRVKILGSAGAFDFGETSSSFLVEDINDAGIVTKRRLIDCGHGINKYLKDNELISKIDEVFITHTHFDHIADLEGLIYYRYFVLNKTTTVKSSKSIIDELKNIFGDRFDTEYVNGQNIKTNMVNYETVGYFYNYSYSEYPEESYIMCNHGTMNAVGFKFNSYKQEDGYKILKTSIIISGDSKANNEIYKELKTNAKTAETFVVFHDFSDFDNAALNIHMCKTDYNCLYKDLVDELTETNEGFAFIKYHNKKNIGTTIDIKL